jgi:hypothetical protein
MATGAPTRMSRGAPSRKVVTSGIAGALVTIIVWVVQAGFKISVPSEVAAAAVTIVSAVVGYVVPPSQSDMAA